MCDVCSGPQSTTLAADDSTPRQQMAPAEQWALPEDAQGVPQGEENAQGVPQGVENAQGIPQGGVR